MNIRPRSRKQVIPNVIIGGVNLGEMSREELKAFVVNNSHKPTFGHDLLDLVFKIDQIKIDQEFGTGIFDEAGNELSWDQAKDESLL